MNPNPKFFYCPNSIDTITSFFSDSFPDDGTLKYRHGFFKNIGYSVQYLEYLDDLLVGHNLHGTVQALTRKSFIISAMGVVEAVLWYVLVSTKQQKTNHWVESHELKCNPFVDGNKKRRLRVILEDYEDEPTEIEMTLDSMCKKVESKKLLGLDNQVYRDLNRLRSLRNRVHIHAVQHDKDTDWWSFGSTDIQLMKKSLYSILTCELFSASKDKIKLFSFIEPDA